MKSELNFIKEGDNIVLLDKNVYESIDDVQQLYNTFKAMHLQRVQHLDQAKAQITQLEEEVEVSKSRYNQIKSFLKQEGIEIDEEGITLE